MLLGLLGTAVVVLLRFPGGPVAIGPGRRALVRPWRLPLLHAHSLNFKDLPPPLSGGVPLEQFLSFEAEPVRQPIGLLELAPAEFFLAGVPFHQIPPHEFRVGEHLGEPVGLLDHTLKVYS